MSNQITNGLLWKPGKSGNIEFCGNWKRLQENEPATAALIFGHESHEGFETQDSEYSYKIYRSQYGYSVGRRKKQVFIPDKAVKVASTTTAPKTKEDKDHDFDLFDDALRTVIARMDDQLKRLDNITNSVDNLIYYLSESNSHTDTAADSIREKIIKQ
jgi:hypothetical protein